MTYSDTLLTDIFRRTKTIALVGASLNPARPSHYVGQFLVEKGYVVYPINPGHAGKSLFGQTIQASLADVPKPVDMVDIFRKSEACPQIVDEALASFPDLRTIWMQIGVHHEGAAQIATARGVDVIMNRCPKIEYPRLFAS